MNTKALNIFAILFLLSLTIQNLNAQALDIVNSSNDTLLHVQETGKVGIGTAKPTEQTKLHVKSNNRFSGYFSSDSLSELTQVLHAEYIGISGDEDVRAVYGKSVPAANFGFGGYFEGGYRGVHALATITGSGDRFGVYGTGQNGNMNFGVYGTSIGGTTATGVYGFATGASGNNYAVYANGNLAYTGSLINVSDAKFKENIRPVTDALAKVRQLSAKKFSFTKQARYAQMKFASDSHYGLIAQDVEKVLPELVSDEMHPGSIKSGQKDNGALIKYKGVRYLELIPLLIESIKEQQTMIEKQQLQIINLQTQMERLRK